MRLGDLGEFGLIERIKRITAAEGPDVLVGIDDDAAVVRIGEVTLVVTTDAFVENVHFRWDYFRPFDLGWRLMAANLSDLAAMGAQPRFAFVDIALPESAGVEQVEDCYRGMRSLADRYGVRIVGGDTTSSPERWFLGLTLIGEAEVWAERAGAKPGDLLVVTGQLGGSLAGYRLLSEGGRVAGGDPAVEKHLRPEPRVEEARFLVREAGVRTMVDISDGLSNEVGHICRLSGVGARVFADQIPIHPRTVQVAEELGEDPLAYALNGGEDFELLFAVPAERWEGLRKVWHERFTVSLTQVGEVRPATDGVKLRTAAGERDLPPAGWQHFSTGSSEDRGDS